MSSSFPSLRCFLIRASLCQRDSIIKSMRSSSGKKDTRLRIKVKSTHICLFFIIWMTYISVIGRNANPMTTCYVGLTGSLVDYHTLQIDQHLYQMDDVAFYNGHYYSGVFPGLSFLLLPVYALLKCVFHISLTEASLPLIAFIGTMFTSSLLGALSAVLFIKIGEHFCSNKYQRILVVIVFAFGTSMFPYSSILLGRIVCVFLLLSAYLLILETRKKQGKGASLFLAGLSCGTSLLFDTITAIFVPTLFIYLCLVFRRKKPGILFLAGTLIPVTGLFLYDYALFGNIFDMAYNHRLGERQQSFHAGGIMGITFPQGDALTSLLLSYGNSLFVYMPFLVLSFYALIRSLKDKKHVSDGLLILALFIQYCWVISSYNAAHVSGFGQRYFIPLIPFLVLPLFFIRFESRSTIFHVLFSITTLAAVSNNIVGAVKLWNFRFHAFDNNLMIYYKYFFENNPRTNDVSIVVKKTLPHLYSNEAFLWIFNYVPPIILISAYAGILIIIYKKYLFTSYETDG